MELFTAGDESQMDVIRQWIDASDVFLLILGGRYGSVAPTSGKSYTHIEYECAIERKKPLFACVIAESALASRVKVFGSSVVEIAHPAKLHEFRAIVLNRVVKFWEDAKDIRVAVGETLGSLARRSDLGGWIRASEQPRIGLLHDHMPSDRLDWQYDGSALLEVEKGSDVQQIWIVSPHLANDTGTAYEVLADRPSALSTIDAVQYNLERKVHYTFVVPNAGHIRARLPQLRRNYES
jgi:hypothetical protein